MSKFLSLIEQVMADNEDQSSEDKVLARIAKKKKDKVELTPSEVEIDNLNNQVFNNLKQKLTKSLTEQDDPMGGIPQAPTPGVTGDISPDQPEEIEIDKLSPEGEVFLVDLIKKALFVDLDNIDLNTQESDIITHDVTPENAKEVVKVLKKIISDFGLGD